MTDAATALRRGGARIAWALAGITLALTFFAGCKEKSVLRSSYARERYDPSVRLLWSRHHGGVSDETATWLTRSHGQTESERIKRAFRRLKRALPNMPELPRHSRCAVVGNSRNLLGAGGGEKIDGFPAVFRTTRAPTEGFESDVGTKTTYHVMVPQAALPGRFDPAATVVLYASRLGPLDALSRFLLNRARGRATRGPLPPVARRALNTVPLKNVRVLHPDFLRYVAENWAEPDSAPSPGLTALVLALHRCEDVHVFGFGPDADGGREPYFAKRTRKGGRRGEADSVERILERLSETKAVTLHPGKR